MITGFREVGNRNGLGASDLPVQHGIFHINDIESVLGHLLHGMGRHILDAVLTVSMENDEVKNKLEDECWTMDNFP